MPAERLRPPPRSRNRRAAPFDPASAPDTSPDSQSDSDSDFSSGSPQAGSSAGDHAAAAPRPAGTLSSNSFAPTNATAPASVLFSLDVTPPIACRPVNITFAPLGLAPYHVTVAISNQYTYSFEIPHNYAPLDRGLWSYEWTVPLIPDNFTSMVVALTDASGAMANTSRIQTIATPLDLPSDCPQPALPADFFFYSSGAPLQCERWNLIYESTQELTSELSINLTNGHALPPFTVYYYPEQHPPISYEIPPDAWSSKSLNGTASVLLPMRASTAFLYSMADSGPYPQGGVSLRNVMGLDENYLNDSCLDVDIPGYGRQIPRPSATAAPMSLAGLPQRYVTTTFSYKFFGSSTSSPIAAVQTVVEGFPLPGYHWGSPGSLGPGHSNNRSALSGGQIAGVVVAVVGCAILVMMAVVIGRCVARKRRRDGGVTAWDLPASEGDKGPNQLYSQAPITHGIFTGRTAYFPAPSEASTDALQPRTGTTGQDDPDVTAGTTAGETSYASTSCDPNPPLVSRTRSESTSTQSVRPADMEPNLTSTVDPSTSLRPHVPDSPMTRVPSSVGEGVARRTDTQPGSRGRDPSLVGRARSLSSMPMRGPDPSMGLEMGTVSSDHTQVRVRQHLDAGVVLMDDNEAGEVVDLPPQYESLSAAYAPTPYGTTMGQSPYPVYSPYYHTNPYASYSYYVGSHDHAQLDHPESPYRATESYTGPPAQFSHRPPPTISPAHPLPFPGGFLGAAPTTSTTTSAGSHAPASRADTADTDALRPLVPPSAPSRSRVIVSHSLVPLSPPEPETALPHPVHDQSPNPLCNRAADVSLQSGSEFDRDVAPRHDVDLGGSHDLELITGAGAPESTSTSHGRGQQHPLSAPSSPSLGITEDNAALWLDRVPTPPPAPPRRRYFAFVGEGQELGPHDTLADELPRSHRGSIRSVETSDLDIT